MVGPGSERTLSKRTVERLLTSMGTDAFESALADALSTIVGLDPKPHALTDELVEIVCARGTFDDHDRTALRARSLPALEDLAITINELRRLP